MKHILTSAIAGTTGMRFKSGTLVHLQAAYAEALNSITQERIGGGYDPTKAYLMYGCVNSGTGVFYNISAGAIFYNGEVYQVPATSFTIGGSNVAVGVLTTTYFTDPTADAVTFTDGTPRNVHEILTINFGAGLSGSGVSDYTNLVYMSKIPQGALNQIIDWMPPTLDTSWFDGTGLGTNPHVKGWAIANGNNGTVATSGKVVASYFPSDTNFGTIGGSGGEAEHALTITEMPSHTHVQTVFQAIASGGNIPAGYTNATPDVSGPYSTHATGGGGAHNNLQPYITALKLQRIA